MSPPEASRTRNPALTRARLVDAARDLMLRQGFAATSVDDICAAAGLTKGSFFHYFETKEALALEAVKAWGEFGMGLYAAAWRDPDGDPLDQLHQMFDIMTGFTRRPDQPCVCLVGMMTQELAATNPAMRRTCAGELAIWTAAVERLLAEAKKRRRPKVDFDPQGVAWMLNSLWQGSMLVAKAREHPDLIARNIAHARAYVDGLFGLPPEAAPGPARRRKPARSRSSAKARSPR